MIRSALGRLLHQGHARTVKAKKNVLVSILARAVGMLVGFIYFPISLAYLGQARFGLFLTLTSTVDWFKDFDVGIGNGLRNRMGEAIADDNNDLARGYVSTAYFFVGILVTLLATILLIANYTLPWTSWIQASSASDWEMRTLLTLIIVAFAIRFVAVLVYQVFYALQHAGTVDVFKVAGKVLFFLLLLILVYFTNDSLILFGGVKTLAFALVPLVVGLYFFRNRLRTFRPAIKHASRSLLGSLFSIGLMFFVIKISMVVIFQTNNMLIAGFVSVDKVAEYQAAYKYLSIFLILFHIITAQLWGANIEAYRKGDIPWMRKSMQGVLNIWFLTLLMGASMVILSPYVYEIWLQDKMQVSLALTVVIAISIACTTWVNIYNLVLNGTGKIRLQMYAWILASVLNIPISILMAKGFGLGVIGIEIGTIISMLPLIVLSPLQVKKILALNDTGIWSK